MGFCAGQFPRLWRMGAVLKKTSKMIEAIDSAKLGQNYDVVDGRLQVIKELNHFL